MRLQSVESPAAAAAQSGAAADRRVTLSPIAGGEVAASERRIAYWLTGVSILVLIIDLANAATLVLICGARRQRELTIRTALGASRGRLFTQVLIEAALLAAVATRAALTLAYWFDEAVRRVLLPSLIESTAVNLRVLGGAAIAAILAFVMAAIAGSAQIPVSFRPGDIAAASRGPQRKRTHAVLLVIRAPCGRTQARWAAASVSDSIRRSIPPPLTGHPDRPSMFPAAK